MERRILIQTFIIIFDEGLALQTIRQNFDIQLIQEENERIQILSVGNLFFHELFALILIAVVLIALKALALYMCWSVNCSHSYIHSVVLNAVELCVNFSHKSYHRWSSRSCVCEAGLGVCGSELSLQIMSTNEHEQTEYIV